MKLFDIKHIGFIVSALILSACMSSCVFENFDEDNGREGLTDTDTYLELRLALETLGSRADDSFEAYEDVIDFSGIRLLFFTADPENDAKNEKLIKLFISNDLEIIPVQSSGYGSTLYWYVRIPVDDENFVQTIREKAFKIAVLANWHSGTLDLQEADPLDKLHHLVVDNDYSASSSVYNILLDDDNKLGQVSDWVIEGQNEKAEGWKGVTPSAEHLIPMYGIQEYEELGKVWKEGTTFDLSNFNRLGPGNYTYHDISLLRSVAKVELYLPKSLEAHSVFIRNFNREARCEPVDISSSTGDVWWDKIVTNNQKTVTEWGKIMGKVFYGNSEFDSYDAYLKYYYGNWFNSTGQNEYPQIINPKVKTVDYAEFIEAESDDEKMERYVIYLPEKFVDDPTDPDVNKSDPKVCHIEFRIDKDPDPFDPDNEKGIDDNNAYRIYFIENGVDDAYIQENGYPDFSDADKTWEKLYEQNTDVLKKHWPIIRNHNYVFTVDGGGGKIAVKLKVLPWKRKDISVTW